VLIKAGKLPRALPFLEYSLKLEETAFAYKWIGLINLDKNKFDAAIQNLEIVYNLDIKDAELFYNLGIAYYKTGKNGMSKKMLSDLKSLKVNDPQVIWMINTLDKLVQKSENQTGSDKSSMKK
jgi:tetratricopeptide (TPR) repeat protein